jgi:hypothetical protein
LPDIGCGSNSQSIQRNASSSILDRRKLNAQSARNKNAQGYLQQWHEQHEERKKHEGHRHAKETSRQSELAESCPSTKTLNKIDVTPCVNETTARNTVTITANQLKLRIDPAATRLVTSW